MDVQILIAFIFGAVFVITLLVVALVVKTPTRSQEATFRTILALAAAGVGAMIPGFLDVDFSVITGLIIRSGGAIALFVVVYFFTPALTGDSQEREPTTSDEGSQMRRGDPTSGNDDESADIATTVDDARTRMENYIDQLQDVFQKGLVDPEIAKEQLGAIVTLVQGAARDWHYGLPEIREFFERGSEASRIVALVLAELRPNGGTLPIALDAIQNPRSPWEQYLALLVLEHLLPVLSQDEKHQATAAIQIQRSGGPGQYITPRNQGRWEAASRILEKLEGD